MKFRRNLLWMVVSGLCLVSAQLSPLTVQAADPSAAPVDKPQWLVSVNGQKISTDTFNLFYGERLRQSQSPPSPQMQSQVISDLVNLMLVAEDARRKGLDKQPEVQNALKLEEDQLLSRLAVQALANAINPTDEELKKAFEAQTTNRSHTEYKVRHILIPSENEAKELIKKLDAGTKFDELATPRTKNGGSENLGWINPDDVVAPFAEAIKAMKPGTHSKQPVKTDFGWHVILLEETRDTPPPIFETAKDELIAGLKQQAVMDYLTGLRDKAKIELNPALTAKAPEGTATGGDNKPTGK